MLTENFITNIGSIMVKLYIKWYQEHSFFGPFLTIFLIAWIIDFCRDFYRGDFQTGIAKVVIVGVLGAYIGIVGPSARNG